jgi:1-aminocyclopropane-1-carboxylate deaminase/D-cysteine desulfhydrase-like pyridoxal-dependent ACC family enzyme
LPERPELIEFYDDWVGPGYEQPTPMTLAAIRCAAQREGLVLDPTYTGKAFCALLDWSRQEQFTSKPNVLFWHTGGLVNLLASDYSHEIGQQS